MCPWTLASPASLPTHPQQPPLPSGVTCRSQPTEEGGVSAGDVRVAGWLRQTWELTVRNFRCERAIR